MIFTAIMAHLVGDFFFQTKKISIGKSTTPGLVVHVLLILLAQLLIFGIYKELNALTLMAIILITVMHFGIDYFRSNVIRIRPANDTIIFFFTDQLLHLAAIWLILGRLGISTSFFTNYPYKVWAILAIINTYFVSFIVYYLQKDLKLYSGFYKRDYMGYVERLLITVFIIFSYYPLAVLTTLVKNALLYLFKKKINYWQAILGPVLSFAFTFGGLLLIR